jgi:hypothetical protein
VETAAVLGYSSVGLVDAGCDVLEMGMMSMSAVELRTTLIGRTGLGLPEALIHDLYKPAVIADLLLSEFE